MKPFYGPTCYHSNGPWPQHDFISVIFLKRQADRSDVISVNSAAFKVNQRYITIIVVTFDGEVGMNYEPVRADDLLPATFSFVYVQLPKAYLDIPG